MSTKATFINEILTKISDYSKYVPAGQNLNQLKIKDLKEIIFNFNEKMNAHVNTINSEAEYTIINNINACTTLTKNEKAQCIKQFQKDVAIIFKKNNRICQSNTRAVCTNDLFIIPSWDKFVTSHKHLNKCIMCGEVYMIHLKPDTNFCGICLNKKITKDLDKAEEYLKPFFNNIKKENIFNGLRQGFAKDNLYIKTKQDCEIREKAWNKTKNMTRDICNSIESYITNLFIHGEIPDNFFLELLIGHINNYVERNGEHFNILNNQIEQMYKEQNEFCFFDITEKTITKAQNIAQKVLFNIIDIQGEFKGKGEYLGYLFGANITTSSDKGDLSINYTDGNGKNISTILELKTKDGNPVDNVQKESSPHLYVKYTFSEYVSKVKSLIEMVPEKYQNELDISNKINILSGNNLDKEYIQEKEKCLNINKEVSIPREIFNSWKKDDINAAVNWIASYIEIGIDMPDNIKNIIREILIKYDYDKNILNTIFILLTISNFIYNDIKNPETGMCFCSEKYWSIIKHPYMILENLEKFNQFHKLCVDYNLKCVFPHWCYVSSNRTKTPGGSIGFIDVGK